MAPYPASSVLADFARPSADKRTSCGNKLIAALPPRERCDVQRHATTARFVAGQALHRRDDVVRHVYFPGGGACALLGARVDNQGLEIAVIGNEGVIGANVFFGETAAAADAVVSIGNCAALVMSADIFNDAMAQHGAFHNLVVRYSQALIGQMAQLCVCNSAHPADARACRWLLTAGDRVGPEKFQLSCGLVAKRLGVSAASMIRIVAGLSRSGAIEYSHGFLRITNRELLVRHACDCYGALNAMFSRLLPELCTSKHE